MRMLLIEDDKHLTGDIKDAIKGENYTVDWAEDAESFILALIHESFDVAILDLGLDDCDGLEVLETVREKCNQIPILVLSEHDSTWDRVLGLDAGADDYMGKPFDSKELKARLRSIIRRGTGRGAPIIAYRGIEIHPSSQKVMCKERVINLTRNEYIILKALIDPPGKVLSKMRLEEKLYGWQDGVLSNTIEFYIHHLRKKLFYSLIHTIRGVGYIIEIE
ncbi:MAG: response regulator transcription factor [Verrucomicrobiales bacterium]